MTVYILAEFPFALRADGRLKEKNTTYCEFEANENALIEILPLDLSPAKCFLAGEAFFGQSTVGAVKVRLKKGYFLKLEQRPHDLPFSLLFQKKPKGAVLTAYADGTYKFSAETQNDYFALSFGEKISDAGEFFFENERFFYAYSEKKRLVCLRAEPRLEKVFDGSAENFSFDGTFVTESSFGDFSAHVTKTEWAFDGTAFRPRRSELKKRDGSSFRALPDELIPYAFAEAVLSGDDPSPYLSEDLAKKISLLRDYLGRYVGVFPPPKKENDILPALLYPEKEGVYSCKSLSCEILSGKIVNLTLI